MNEVNELIKETLKKQLELLSKRSETCSDEMLPSIASVIVNICAFIFEN